MESSLLESWSRLSRDHVQNVCVLVTAITNEVTVKDNCKFMLDATIRVCSLLTER